MENQLLELFSESESKPKRKNNPELLRHSILIAAKNLMLQDGIANLSMQKVADAAGTSKGGLFHHFKNKDELILSVLELFIAQVNTTIMQHINEMGEVKGVFTRAYVSVFFENAEIGLSSDWSGLIRAMNAESKLAALWDSWLLHKVGSFSHTDSDIRLTAIRYAVDGAWLNNIDMKELPAIRDYLMTLIDDIVS